MFKLLDFIVHDKFLCDIYSVTNKQSGNLVGKVTDAHAGLITSLLVVHDDVWSSADDGSIKSWNIMVIYSFSVYYLVTCSFILSRAGRILNSKRRTERVVISADT